MDAEIIEDEIPSLFEMVLEELNSPEGAASSLASDAFGVGDNTVRIPRPYITKEVVIAALENLEYYEKVWGTVRSQGSSVSIVSGYGLEDQVIRVRSPAEARGFFSSKTLCPDQLWGPPSLLSNGY
jgi:hypothetical protein